MGPRGRANWWAGNAAQAAILLSVCIAAYWAWLGTRPFDFTEGHRVIPGWTMLETGDWQHLRMFELTYLRKPPGMPWAIAAFSSVFGQTELGARAVSAACATLMSLIAWAFARRWLGPGPWALAAGLAQALLPLMWSPGRTAEIEMLNNLGTQLLAFGVIDGFWRRWFVDMSLPEPIRPSRSWMVSLACTALGAIIALFAKGPAGLPVLAGVLAGAVILSRSARPLFRAPVVSGLLLAACIALPVWIIFSRANHDPLAVHEDVNEHFLWSRGRIMGVLTLAPLAFLSALPASLALLFVFGRQARLEAAEDDSSRDAYAAARLCGFGWLSTIGILLICGVSNPRYAMPGAALLPPIAGYAIRGVIQSRRLAPGSFREHRRIWAGRLFLDRPIAWFVVLLAGAIATAVIPLVRRGDADAGLAAASHFADALPDNATVWADDAIEARPDVLLYARRFKNGSLRPVWAKPWMARAELPSPGSFVLLRTDADSPEGARYAEAITRGRLQSLLSAKIRTYVFTLYRVIE